MTTDFTACVQTEFDLALIQSSIVLPIGLTLTCVAPSRTAYTSPVAFKASIAVTAAPGFGIVEKDNPVFLSFPFGG
mgnify:CR=1 FL=1